MRFTCPAQLQRYAADEIVVSFRDLEECQTSAATESEALAEAADPLEEAVAGRLNRADEFPAPSKRRAGERTRDRDPRGLKASWRASATPARILAGQATLLLNGSMSISSSRLRVRAMS